jgi:hypothetical protein
MVVADDAIMVVGDDVIRWPMRGAYAWRFGRRPHAETYATPTVPQLLPW